MKKKQLLTSLSLSCIALLSGTVLGKCSSKKHKSCDFEATGKTTLTNMQPPFTSVTPELVSAQRSDFNQARENGWGGALQFAAFGGRSADKDDLARYFFPDAKTTLTVVETGPADDQVGFNNGEQDLLAQNFNIFTTGRNYKGTIEMGPQQSIFGLGIYWRQSFWKLHKRGRGFWFSVSSPITHMKNVTNLTESVETDSAADTTQSPNAVNNMIAALNQESWNFGKISTCAMKKTGLADIELKIGYEWLQHQPAHMETYVGIIIPTSNRQKGIYLFEPVIGRSGHAGVMFGSSLGLDIWENESADKMIRFELANHSEYQFDREQVRSFDLAHKPWSRYLPLYANAEQAQEAADLFAAGELEAGANLATPGINILTQKVKVTPGLVHNVNSAFVFSVRRFEAEVGYNFFARRAECVKLACPWQEGPAIKYFEGAGQTNPIRTISGNPYYEQLVSNASNTLPLLPKSVADYNLSIIKETDLDLQSATTPCTLSNKLYGTLGYRNNDREYPIFASVGGSYAFSKNNNAASRGWLIWGKMGLAF
jgi:hypothetical protein